MSKLQDLIKELCPDGVEFGKLGECLYSIKTGLNPRRFFVLNSPDAKNFYVTIREIKGGNLVFTEKTDRINDEALGLCNNRSNLEIGDVLFSGTGTIGETYVIETTPHNWNIKEGVYSLKPKKDVLIPKYLKYILDSRDIKDKYLAMAEGGTVKSVSMKLLASLEIPFPPLEVQNEIVRILDTFTSYAAELQAELQARKEQYEYYRNKLLTFDENDEGVKWMTFGEIGNICMCKRIMKHQTSDIGEVPFFKIGTFGKKADAFISYDLYDEYKNKYSFPRKGEILISASGTIGRTVIYDGQDAYFQDSNIIWIQNDESKVLNKYLYYYYQIIEWNVEGGTIKRLYNTNLSKTIIAYPSLSEQQRIVSILDKFESLVNDLTAGLPAEIAAVQEQYEYYRNKLLTFKRIS